MGDLSDFLPKVSETVDRIYAHYKAKGDAEPRRGYLGASQIGHECDRYLWYAFRDVVREEIDGRLYRLFETGHLEEGRLVANLRAIGCEVHDKDGNGEQFGFTALGDHFSGHLDGVATGVPEAPKTPHLIELKTAKAEKFENLLKKGIRAAYPMHFAQAQTYMGAMGLTRCLYLVRNKDTDALYSERFDFEPAAYKALLDRAKRVVTAVQPLERVASRVDDWRCKFCPAHALCWGADEKAPAVPIRGRTCRSCVHATPLLDRTGAKWSCAKYGTELETTDVGAKCPSHLLLPGLVGFAEPVDSDGESIEFQSRDGSRWVHGNGAGQWSTDELLAGRGPLAPGAKPPVVSSTTVLMGGRHVAGPAPTADPTTGAAPAAAPTAATSASPSECGICHDPECDSAEHLVEEAEHEAGRQAAQESLLAVDFLDETEPGPHVLLASYEEGELLWNGPADALGAAIRHHLGVEPSALGEPRRTQDDAAVSAAEFRFPSGDYFVVRYKADDVAAIWRGKA